jgi:hypothetical protein|tara:strand:+ start:4309 stop:4464 length:156 start_codon:yes stop_codon:yes gene_type:complete
MMTIVTRFCHFHGEYLRRPINHSSLRGDALEKTVAKGGAGTRGRAARRQGG